MSAAAWETCPRVWVTWIDIGGGVYEPLHAFGNQAEAEAYMEWQASRGGERCRMAELPIEQSAGVAA